VDVKAKSSALISPVEGGEEIAITRHAEIVAGLVPDRSVIAADSFHSLPDSPTVDTETPEDPAPEPAAGLD
jgi:antitoxin (DNA-binding transcriptional repressor) of toxin-antitoxin stability system